MNLKLSKYIVLSKIQNTKSSLVFSTRTAEAVTLHDDTIDILEKGNFALLEENLLPTLLNLSILVPDDEDELMEIISENKAATKDNDVLYQVIQPSANCQLGCHYCGQVHTKGELGKDDYEKLLNRLEYKLSLKQYRALEIAWFGGEPLMGVKTLRDLSYKLQDLASKHNLEYSSRVVTNGLSLKKALFLDLVHFHKVGRFEVTLDGIAEFHDKRRHLKSGEKSFEIIFNNLVDILTGIEDYDTLGTSISIRCNVDSTNYEGVIPLLHLIKEYKLEDKISHFYVAPIHSWGNNAHLISLEKELFANKEIDWLIEQHKLGFKPTFMPSRVRQVCLTTSQGYEVLDAGGKIYNCTEVSQVPGYEESPFYLGNIREIPVDKEFGQMHLQNWNDIVLLGNDGYPCTTCEMLPVCGGGCPKNWSEGINSCPPSKFNIKDKLVLQTLIKNNLI